MKLLLILAALPLFAFAADPEGFTMYTAADLKTRAANAKLDEHHVGADRIASWGNHSLMVIRRTGDGEAEVHDTQVDVLTIISGEATLVIGGTVVDGHPTTPGEIRGKSIKGGMTKKMMPGDVFHIPAKLPHQMLVPKEVVFQVVKVETK